MTKIASVLSAAKARARGVAAAAAFVLAGATGAVAQTAIDVPAQSFGHGQASAKPAVSWRPDASSSSSSASGDRGRPVGPSFRVNVPVGAGGRTPLNVHIFSSEEVCRYDDVTGAGVDRDNDFVRDTRGR